MTIDAFVIPPNYNSLLIKIWCLFPNWEPNAQYINVACMRVGWQPFRRRCIIKNHISKYGKSASRLWHEIGYSNNNNTHGKWHTKKRVAILWNVGHILSFFISFSHRRCAMQMLWQCIMAHWSKITSHRINAIFNGLISILDWITFNLFLSLHIISQ